MCLVWISDKIVLGVAVLSILYQVININVGGMSPTSYKTDFRIYGHEMGKCSPNRGTN